MKTREWVCAAVVVSGLLVPLRAKGQFIPIVSGTQRDTATISVSGIGEVIVAPARAIVFVQIETEHGAGGAAVLANGALRSRVTEELASLGFEASLWGYGVGPVVNRGRIPSSGQPGSEPRYEAKSGIRVVVEPAGRLDEVVSAVLLAGASSVPWVQFEAGESEEARREAARIAVSKARSAAESIAEAAGGRLGDLLNLTVAPDYNMLVTQSRFFQAAFPGQGVRIYLSDVTIKVHVQASWVFESG